MKKKFTEHHEENFCAIILNLDHRFRSQCRLKDFLSRVLVALMFSDVNHLCNLGRGHYEEHLCEIILKGLFHGMGN